MIKTREQYLFLNLVALLAISGIFVYASVPSVHISCVYKARNIRCSACGMTTSLQHASVLEFEKARAVHPAGFALFLFLATILILRLAFTAAVFLLKKAEKVYLADTVISTILFAWCCCELAWDQWKGFL